MFKQLASLFGRTADAGPAEPVGATTQFNVYSTLQVLAQPAFPHKLERHRDLSDPALYAHLNDLCRAVQARGQAAISVHEYHVILHLQRVQHHLTIAIGAADLAAFFEWALGANAIVVTHDGSVLDPQGRVLVGAGAGKCDPQARLPYPPRALARKAATEAALAARAVLVPVTLPPLVCEDELALRSRDAVIERARALLLVALRAESVASGEPMPVETLLGKMPLADDALSPNEQAFLAQAEPTPEQCAPFIWRYESLYGLEWALGLVKELPYPEAACDAASTAAALIGMRGPQLRPVSEILDALDMTYRLHWHVRQARLKQGAVAGIDADVVTERHHTLNWLVQFQHAAWDEVDTPT